MGKFGHSRLNCKPGSSIIVQGSISSSKLLQGSCTTAVEHGGLHLHVLGAIKLEDSPQGPHGISRRLANEDLGEFLKRLFSDDLTTLDDSQVSANKRLCLLCHRLLSALGFGPTARTAEGNSSIVDGQRLPPSLEAASRSRPRQQGLQRRREQGLELTGAQLVTGLRLWRWGTPRVARAWEGRRARPRRDVEPRRP